jgi:hypothetical protein
VQNVDIKVELTPSSLKAFARNEAQLNIVFTSQNATNIYWSECEVVVKPPLSLAHDSEMNLGRTRMGLLKPLGSVSKSVKLYTRPSNYPDEYAFSIIAYLYDDDGAIAERVEKSVTIPCIAEESTTKADV